MKNIRTFTYALICTLIIMSSGNLAAEECTKCAYADTAPLIIGENALLNVEEIGLKYRSRIDTGARTTSIHAINLKIEDEAKEKDQNISKKITFTTASDAAEKEVTSEIIDVMKVSNSQGTEHRYIVELTITWNDVSKKVNVNLRDRGHMTYPLLIGRNWLNSSVKPKILVDCDINELAALDESDKK